MVFRNKEGKQRSKIKWKKILPFYIMALPGLLYLLLNNYVPMFGILIAFKDMDFQKGILGSPWCGFDNFKFLFSSATGWEIMRNTVGYAILFHIVGTICAVFIAILMNEICSVRIKKVFQTLLLLPYLMSWVVVGYLAYAYLSGETGLINNGILKPLGREGVLWYQEPKYWPFILLFFSVWKSLGYNMVVYLSSIVGISSDYYEAARIDGANKWNQIRYITLPLLKPTIVTLSILALGGIFRSDFGLFYQIPRNSGMLTSVTRTLDVYVYEALMGQANYGLSSAVSVYQSFVGLVLIVVANQLIKKYEPDSALF
ncbi:MAG: sugar ABC transporter permease [Roseburia sp.]|nr:sugar ABC transporter permease [Roseburia sp.]